VRLALTVNFSLARNCAGLWGMMAGRDMMWRADFTIFNTGWAIVRDGRGQSLYDLDVRARSQQQILDGRRFASPALAACGLT
jgi:hypothetical protein